MTELIEDNKIIVDEILEILNHDYITDDEWQYIDLLLNSFVENTESILGVQFSTHKFGSASKSNKNRQNSKKENIYRIKELFYNIIEECKACKTVFIHTADFENFFELLANHILALY